MNISESASEESALRNICIQTINNFKLETGQTVQHKIRNNLRVEVTNSNAFYVVDCCPKLSCTSVHKVITHFLSRAVCHMIDILSFTWPFIPYKT